MKTAVIIGATGLVGTELVKALSYSQHYDKIYVIARRAVEFNDKKIEPVVIAFENLEQQKFPTGADYFCALGTTIKQAGSQEAFRKVDHDYVVSFAKIAKTCEANSFHMVSAMGASQVSTNFYSRVKGETEKDVLALGLKKTRIYQPSLLIGTRDNLGQPSRLGEEIVTAVYNNAKFLFKGFMKKYEPITAEKVALAMAKNAISDSAKNKMIVSNREMH
ncbi:NAD-dependent epimerase/dehydratase family protein [Pseudobdellovibrio sp. HCB154]|uniref:NAD-dependent epimerase/dehydratase family protein n=1 Tax=Pseudobdellovibrio sp. HCB154 TaxID=3386277 RepID=UPI0039170998